MTPILTLTMNPTVDIGLDVETLRPSGKCRATVRGVVAGGGGINVARAVVELGGAALALHTAGAETGARLGRLLADEPMDHQAIEIAGETREAVVIHESATGRSYHVVPPGPTLSSTEVEDVIETVVERADRHELVVVSGSSPPGLPDDFLARLADALAASDLRLVLDPSGAALPASLRHGVHVLRVNRREAARLVGTEVRGFDDACRVNEQILGRGWATIAVTTIGEHGAVISADGAHHEVRTPELPGPPVCDAGAGDSFMAGLTLALGRGLDVADAGALAVAAAGASVLTHGTEHCRRDDVERLRPRVEVARRSFAASDTGRGRAASRRVGGDERSPR